jgi:hypothetical protein
MANELSEKTIILNKGIPLFYVTADSFPDGIMAAHQALHKLVPFSNKRNYYGLSRPEKGGAIVYRAAAEELSEGEGKTLGCETLVLKKGTYACTVIKDYLQNLPAIQKAFSALLQHPHLDPQGYCVEWYFNETDVSCMVRLKK